MKTNRIPMGLWTIVAAEIFNPGLAKAGDWWLQAGPVYRTGMTVRVTGGSRTQGEGVHAGTPVPSADSGGYADREYDDGYVKLDAGTQDPNAVGGPGLTWNWAYDRTEQYQSSGQTLSFKRALDDAAMTTQNAPISDYDELDGLGLGFQAGRLLSRGERWQLDLALGFQGVWGLESRQSMQTYAENIGRLQLTDRFNVAGAVHPDLGFPPPRTASGGYTGTYDGPAGTAPGWAGGYPVIPNTPVGRDAQMAVTSVAANRVEFRFDEVYYEITLSPRLGYRFSPTFSGYLAPKLGVAVAAVDAQRTETFTETLVGGASTTLRTWTDATSQTEALFTCGVSAGVEAALGKGFFAGLFGGYDWVINPMEFDLGPNQIKVDNSGWSVGLALRKDL
jgi:hypothetical protein